MVAEAVEQRGGELLVAEDLHPLAEAQVGRHQGRAPLVTLGEDVEEQLTAGPIEGDKPQFVNLC